MDRELLLILIEICWSFHLFQFATTKSSVWEREGGGGGLVLAASGGSDPAGPF